MKQPNLFIVGAPKCGTTSLAKWLNEHPDIFLPSIKEPHHYNTDEKQVSYPSRDHYLSLYSDGAYHQYRLDASVWYLHSKEAATNILKDHAEARFIVCLRNPVDMAFSLHSQYLNVTGRENVKSFEKAWELSDKRISGKRVPKLATDNRYLAYKYSCCIGSQTRRLLNTVPPSQVHLIVLDDLKQNPEETLRSLLHFLRLPESIPLSIPHENPSQNRSSPMMHRILLRLRALKYALGINHPTIRKAGRFLSQWNSSPTKSRIDEATRKHVTQYFLDEIQIIWEITGNRYPHWVECLSDKIPPDSLK